MPGGSAVRQGRVERVYEAFGERKSLRAWGSDPRCPVSPRGLVYRVRIRGMSVEQAFAATDGRCKHVHEAFGQCKTLRAWSRDPRCHVSLMGLYRRVVRRGMTIEQAFARGPDPRKSRREALRSTPVTVWGEAKTAAEWAADPRAKVPAESIAKRVRKGYAAEDAISKTARELAAQRIAARVGKHYHEAFGERKTLGAWGRDPRCPTSRQGLFYRVLVAGLTVEEAFALGSHDPGRKPTRPNRGKKPGRKPRWATLTAWGETKSVEEWAHDPRAGGPAHLILSRLRRGYPPEAAVATPRWRRLPGERGTASAEVVTPITAWGETRTAAEWALDPRAKVPAHAILRRIAAGYTPEQAISHGRWESRRPGGEAPASPAGF